jgi:hypothetical protein
MCAAAREEAGPPAEGGVARFDPGPVFARPHGRAAAAVRAIRPHGTSRTERQIQMTNQMQRLISRVDGMLPEVPPVSILTPVGSTYSDTAPTHDYGDSRARGRALRETRQRAGVLSGRVPRAIETLVCSEVGDMHAELLAAGLL